MGVRELLAEEDGGFISLDDVLRHVMHVGGCDYSDAATFVFRRLRESIDRFNVFEPEDCDPPAIYMRRPAHGVTPFPGGQRRVLELLEQATRDGDPADISF